MMTVLSTLWHNDQGQDLIEYSLLMAFIAVAAVGSLMGGRQRQRRLDHH
jgi:Flp pilus assembly pilin Flp